MTPLTGVIGAKYPTRSRYARRAEIARDAAIAWAHLAKDEMVEELKGEPPLDLTVRGYALGERMLAKLEAQRGGREAPSR